MDQQAQEERAKKVETYLDEVNAIGKKYQFTLAPKLRFTDDGVIPGFSVIDVVPEDEPIEEAPADETGATPDSQPATPEEPATPEIPTVESPAPDAVETAPIVEDVVIPEPAA